VITQKPIIEHKAEEKKMTVKPDANPQPSVKELFKLEPKPEPKPVSTKPAKDKSTKELFEDLF